MLQLVSNLSDYLEKTGFFSMGPSQPGSLNEVFFGSPAGTEIFPAEAGGYWLMVEGLTPGTHTLHFGGAFDQYTVDTPLGTFTIGPGSTDTTAIINVVVPEPSSALLLLVGLIPLFGLRRHRAVTE